MRRGTLLFVLLFEFEYALVELIILSLFGNQLFVVSALDDATVVKHHNDVGIANGRETVRNYEYRSALHKTVHTCGNYCLSSRINGRRSLVEYHYGRVCDGSSCDREQLTL